MPELYYHVHTLLWNDNGAQPRCLVVTLDGEYALSEATKEYGRLAAMIDYDGTSVEIALADHQGVCYE